MPVDETELPPERVAAVADLLGVGVTPAERAAFSTRIRSSLPLDDLAGAVAPDDPRETRVTAFDFDPGTGSDPLNAFVSTFSLADGPSAGSLSDLTLALKDNIAVAGVPLTCGSRAFADLVPSKDAAVTERLLAAATSLVGKTNQDELAYSSTGESSAFGPTRNPVDETLVPGGSSSGSAAAVGAGTVDAALGSDTGGSVRIPAALCGVVGFKPSWGVVPRTGFVDLAYTLDTIGPLARDVTTAARVMDVIAGPETQDPSSTRADRVDGRGFAASVRDPRPLTSLTLGVPEAFFDETLSDSVRTVVDGRLADLADAGATLDPVSVPSLDDCRRVLGTIVTTELAASLLLRGVPVGRPGGVDPAFRTRVAAAFRANGEQLGPFVRRKAIEGYASYVDTGGEMYVRARAATERLRAAYDPLFEAYDALVTPTVPVSAPALGEWTPSSGLNPALARATRPANLLGGAALSVPAGRAGNCPVGLQFMTAPYEDTTAFEVGRRFELLIA
jgi:amidase/aspartyl-tRNA(Asn)/glutamyl-tRNA(Gln) amidotransferase subunit A